jgi:hypothetical protein
MKEIGFGTAFKYPFNRPVGMLNILWIFLPIIGWFALGGYGIRIVKHFTKGDFKELPEFKFGKSFKIGFFMFLKAIPFFLVYFAFQHAMSKLHWGGIAAVLFVSIFIVPMLTINFFKKETIGSYFEFDKVTPVFSNIQEYVIAVLKTIGLQLVFFVMIIVLVGFPALVFAKNIFLADFYRRFVK